MRGLRLAFHSCPSWRRAQALFCGTLLAPANHVLAGALRAPGLATDPGFQSCHRLLNRVRWSSLHLLVPIRWARRRWALPFLTALCPSARYAPYVAKGRRHKSLVERARGLIGQAVRWLPDRALTVVADSGCAAIELLAWCQRLPAPVTLITRLRLDAALYVPAPARAAGQKGRPRRKGQRLPTSAERLTRTDTVWKRVRVRWYGGAWRWLEVASDQAVWYHSGLPPGGPTLGAHARSPG